MYLLIATISIGILSGAFIIIWVLIQPSIICPDCNESLPKFRKPQSKRQVMRGGITCRKCGCEVDRKGKKLFG